MRLRERFDEIVKTTMNTPDGCCVCGKEEDRFSVLECKTVNYVDVRIDVAPVGANKGDHQKGE